MTYIILSAGKGVKLQPLTLNHPKALYKLDSRTTILQRLVRQIRKYDAEAEIIVVVGYMARHIYMELEDDNVRFIYNPFYSFTGSLGSLWFAKEFMRRENVTVINGDIVISNKLSKELLCQPTDFPYILYDSTRNDLQKYKVQLQDGLVCVMSNNLKEYAGTYASICKLDAVSACFVVEQLNLMVCDELYNLFFEDALVQMIFQDNFELYCKDIQGYQWTEVDCVDDLLKARQIQFEIE